MKVKVAVVTFSAMLFLSGCATPYRSSGFMGGYSETILAPDTFRIVFDGNGLTSSTRAQEFALLRASDVSLQRGFSHFTVLDEKNTVSVSTYTTPGQIQTTAYGQGQSTGSSYLNPYGLNYSGNSSAYVNATTTYTPPRTSTTYKPTTGILIRAFREKPEGIPAFDAAFLQQSLKEKYKIK